MKNCVILCDCGGKLTASLFASRADAVVVSTVPDETDRLVVTVTPSPDFDPSRDYVVREVAKGSSRPVENELVLGTLPVWAGGTNRAARVLIASSAAAERAMKHQPRHWSLIAEHVRRGFPVEVPNAE